MIGTRTAFLVRMCDEMKRVQTEISPRVALVTGLYEATTVVGWERKQPGVLFSSGVDLGRARILRQIDAAGGRIVPALELPHRVKRLPVRFRSAPVKYSVPIKLG